MKGEAGSGNIFKDLGFLMRLLFMVDYTINFTFQPARFQTAPTSRCQHIFIVHHSSRDGSVWYFATPLGSQVLAACKPRVGPLRFHRAPRGV